MMNQYIKRIQVTQDPLLKGQIGYREEVIAMPDQKEILDILKSRFEKNMHLHENCEWNWIEHKIINSARALAVLTAMEQTGGEPDVIGYDVEMDTAVFCDCSKESPAGRRSLCYDQEALASRKANKPESSATEMAEVIGIQILDEKQYGDLQKSGEFDTKTSSWIKTPEAIRKLGGALFCDRRYDHIFTYHNGADSYYSARGFRGSFKI